MTNNVSRRAFLKGAGQLGVLGAAAPLGLGLAAATRASAANLGSGYKALVCVFLYGGNDSYNTLIPYDTASYNKYSKVRARVAVPRDDLGATILSPNRHFSQGRQFALHPRLEGLKRIFDQNKLALAMNVGTLLQPTTLAQFNSGIQLPPKLMSHNDQFNLWQSLTSEGASSGWGGRMGDIFASYNGEADLVTNISVGPSGVFSSGRRSQEFAIGASGPVNISPAFTRGKQTNDVINLIDRNLSESASNAHLLRKELGRRYGQVTKGNALLARGIDQQATPSMPDTHLGKQLAMVSRIIGANQNIGVRRQIFFVGMGGFDNHGSLNSDHPRLLQELGDAMEAFQQSIDGMAMGRQVTTFTASDFGRSLVTNGRGSDHGWGGHHFVMGGAVKAKHWTGGIPTLELGGADDVGQGRLLPSISVDQYGANLARWMGLSDSEVSDVFPNIGRYSSSDIGLIDWSKTV